MYHSVVRTTHINGTIDSHDTIITDEISFCLWIFNEFSSSLWTPFFQSVNLFSTFFFMIISLIYIFRKFGLKKNKKKFL